jgi:hypothetical protein
MSTPSPIPTLTTLLHNIQECNSASIVIYRVSNGGFHIGNLDFNMSSSSIDAIALGIWVGKPRRKVELSERSQLLVGVMMRGARKAMKEDEMNIGLTSSKYPFWPLLSIQADLICVITFFVVPCEPMPSQITAT